MKEFGHRSLVLHQHNYQRDHKDRPEKSECGQDFWDVFHEDITGEALNTLRISVPRPH